MRHTGRRDGEAPRTSRGRARAHGVPRRAVCESGTFWAFVSLSALRYHLPLTGGSEGKESACNAGDLGLNPGWEDPLEEAMATHASILA